MNNKTIIIYYLYVLLLVVLTGYAVFEKDASGWWFLLTALFSSAVPYSK